MTEYKVPKRLETGDSVNINSLPGTSVIVESTGLDIRPLVSTDVVTVTGSAGQTADVKVTLDGEAITFPAASIEAGVFLKVVDYKEMVARGEVTNHTVGHIIGRGEGAVIPTTTYVILTNATVTQPAANTAMKIVSTSVNDTSAGTGAQQITIEYFPSTWGAGKSEVVTLNGLTPVTLSNTDVFRINNMYINKLGDTGSGADGTITLVDNATGLIKYAQINPGATFFERCIHYVAENKICVITGALLGCSTVGGVDFRIFMTQEDANGNLVPRAEFVVVEASSSQSIIFSLPLKVGNLNNKRIAVGVAVKSRSSNQHASGTLRFYEGDD